MRSRVVAGVVVGMLMVAVVGCAGTKPRASPTPTPPFASAAAAYRAAEATYRGYVEAGNHLDLANPKTFEAVYRWLLGDALDADRKELTTMAANRLKITGHASVKSVSPLPGGDPLWGDISVEACYDVHDVDVVNSSGKSLVSPDRADIERIVVKYSRDGRTRTGMRIIQMKIQDDAGRCAR